MRDAVNLADKLATFTERWEPRTIGRLNGYEVKVVKLEGDFVWHTHETTDELFLVLSGRLRIQLRDRDVEVGAGEMYVVPRGVEHRPSAGSEVHVLLIEPAGVVNTGDAGGPLTAVPRSA